VVVQHIDVQLALPGQALQREVAAANKAGDGVVDIVPKQQIQLGVQRVGQKQLDADLAGAQLAGQGAQRCLVFAGGDAQCDLLAQVRGKLSF